MAEQQAPIVPEVKLERFLEDFEEGASNISQVRERKCKFIREQGEAAWQELVTRSTRRNNTRRQNGGQ